MKTVSATEAKNRFGDLLHNVVYQHEPIMIKRNGKPMAVLVDIDTYNQMTSQLTRPDESTGAGD